MKTPIQLLIILVTVGHAMVAQQAAAFDTGHHWEITSQTLRELGFSDDARQTVCVSNWLLDYYSSNPIASKEVRETLSKLHCDNLRDGESVQRYMSRFTRNAKAAIQSQTNPRDTLLLLGAILHVVQDLYSHSTWPEIHAPPRMLTNFTLHQAGGRVPSDVVSGEYEPQDYVAGQIPSGHPQHGSYHDGINKDSHQREYWEHANYLAYCASYEFCCAVRSWVSKEHWCAMKNLELGFFAQRQLDREVKAAYGISIWVALKGQHGHWKGGESGDNLLFIKSTLQFALSASSNSRWYRDKQGFAPLAQGLYETNCCHQCPPFVVPGLNIQREIVSLRFTCVRACGDGLDPFPGQKEADLYVIGAVYYGLACRKNQAKKTTTISPDSEPAFPIRGKLNSLFRDRVLQDKKKSCHPWAVLAMANPETLCASGHYLSFYIRSWR